MDLIKKQFDEAGNLTIIQLPETFTFRLFNEFRGCYEALDRQGSVEVDLCHVTHLDSSALGMLVAVWEHMGRNREQVRLSNTSIAVRKILMDANFNQLFTIS
ncbi:anti-sigma-factor antagonist [Magnetococcus marinus MC-1]|uniref:Anti-sigma-factor antagonist n=1 Tax=Magnetococcus marinus (strain ATCC BAA-1437 / JCM 17883 / MC-1) TaxID=156889 RepID=A0L4S2_MAGMM|nr:STAS domain-containing protein [Magnetococcus marinus]ABK42965.1 anti-sigma-factor antagonist [Magnetococcus marinus MC-1]